MRLDPDTPLPDQSPSSVRPSGPDEARPCDDADSAGSRLIYPTLAVVFPQIEEEALSTRRAGTTEFAVAVGLGAEGLLVCDGVVGDAATIVVTQDADAASDLLAILRPRLVVSAASLPDADGARLAAAAKSCGAHVVRVDSGAGVDTIARLVRRAARIAFDATPPVDDMQRVLTRSASEGQRP